MFNDFRDIQIEKDFDRLYERIEELETTCERLDAYSDLLIDALEDACGHMRAGDVARLRQRHPKAMEVIE